MAVCDIGPLPNDTSHVSFDELRLGRSTQKVVCRLLRFWDSRNLRRDNEFMGITLLFLDEKKSMTHGFIPAALVDQFRSVLREGLIYRLECFDVGRCTKQYKITESPFVIRFMNHTSVAPVEVSISIEPVKFMIRNSDHLHALANTNLELPDVVGQIRFLQGSNLNDPTSTQRLLVRFRIDKDVIVCLSLWDDVAATFRSHMISDNHRHSVMIVTTVNPKIFGGNLFLNSTPSTRFYFDPTIEAIKKFKERLGIHGDTTTFTRADTTTSLVKMENVTISELQNYISKPTEEVQDADFICKATVVRVIPTNGWSYISCGTCSRKLDRNGSSLRCNKCVSSTITGVVRYRVELFVKDREGDATFVVFDSEMTKQTSRTAATLTVEAQQNDYGEIPPCLQAFVGKTYVFKIRVSPFNFTPNHRTFTVSSMIEHRVPEAEVQEEAPVAEMEIQPPVAQPIIDASNGLPAIDVAESHTVSNPEAGGSGIAIAEEANSQNENVEETQYVGNSEGENSCTPNIEDGNVLLGVSGVFTRKRKRK